MKRVFLFTVFGRTPAFAGDIAGQHRRTPASSEAVTGHEITHVSKGDMVTPALRQGVLNTFVISAARIIGPVIDFRADPGGANLAGTANLVGAFFRNSALRQEGQ